MIRGVSLVGCLAAALVLLAPATAEAQLRTAVVDGAVLAPSRAAALTKIRSTGATMVRIDLNWRAVAPAQRPAAFSPANPDDPAYNWAQFDQTITAAVRAGLDPIVSIVWAPAWAEGPGPGTAGTVRPDPTEFGRFARAAAERYSGSFVPSGDPYAEPLPRVANWMAWNEPNRDYFFSPQYEAGQIASATWYRNMVRRFAAEVRSVNPSNLVVAGGLAPLGRVGKPAPLPFMRSMLCLSSKLRRTCDLRANPVGFDIWSHHPYTSGGPTHKASGGGNVSLGNLPQMRRVLNAAVRLGHVRPGRGAGFWVTEFSWDAKPADPRGVPAALHARWVSEALFRMWASGVSVVTWYRIQDDPLHATPYQSGFYTLGGAPKRSLKAFRFPTVAFARSRGIYVWGRTPTSRPGVVVVERKVGSRWRRLGIVRANVYGTFQRTYRTPVRKGHIRARFASEVSLPFSLKPVADRYVNPFGCGGGIRC